MAPVIWGLDLKEIHYSKFASSYMWNTDYHLRRTKFIVYQLALIFCVISESLGTAALADYGSEQRRVHRLDPRADISNDDYIGAASYNIWAGVFVAFIFGGAFFFDLFWPEREENRSVRIAWKACGVLSVVFYLASAITLTVITFSHQATIHGVTPERARELIDQYKKHKEAPLDYSKNSRAIAAVAFAWPGALAVIGSCILLFLSIDNIEKGPGPKSKHRRARDAERGIAEGENTPSSDKEEPDAERGQAGQIADGAADRPPRLSASAAARTAPSTP